MTLTILPPPFPRANVVRPTIADISKVDCRQNADCHRQMREHYRHSATIAIAKGLVMLETASGFRRLNDDCSLLTICVTDCRTLPIIYGEKPMRIDARVMAWQTAPQKSGTCVITAS